MKKFLVLILLVTISVLVFELYTKTYSPCDNTITYKIGTVDPKFGLTQETVTKDTNKAADILNSAYGKPIFIYGSDEATLSVNFIYDERSALNQNINEQQNRIDLQNLSLQKKIEEYEVDADAFEQKLNEFNKKVSKHNAEGGAPRDAYEELISEQNDLKSMAAALDSRATELNLDTSRYNTQVSRLNKDVSDFNEALTEKPEEGIFDAYNNSITVYFVNTKEELLHTIAHEFGHALDLDHVSDPDAIMYPFSSTSLDFTSDDFDELREVCKEIPAYEYWAIRLTQSLDINIQN